MSKSLEKFEPQQSDDPSPKLNDDGELSENNSSWQEELEFSSEEIQRVVNEIVDEYLVELRSYTREKNMIYESKRELVAMVIVFILFVLSFFCASGSKENSFSFFAAGFIFLLTDLILIINRGDMWDAASRLESDIGNHGQQVAEKEQQTLKQILISGRKNGEIPDANFFPTLSEMTREEKRFFNQQLKDGRQRLAECKRAQKARIKAEERAKKIAQEKKAKTAEKNKFLQEQREYFAEQEKFLETVRKKKG